jgi:exodeoxyribonuclease-3
VRLRIGLVARLTEEIRPDVLCLQETKVQDPHFPAAELEAMGYAHQIINGMKSYNGVAILSRVPLENAGSMDWCDRSDCRHVYATVPGGIEIHNFYIPAGGDEPDPAINDKFAHKLRFLADTTEWWRGRNGETAKRVLVGDLNIAPLESDVWSHKQLLKVVSHTPVEVEHLDRLQEAGAWIDAVRHFVPEDEKLYSWWSYRARDWSVADKGRRLDHIWVTPPLAKRLKSAAIHRDTRGWPQPSDHAPVTVEINV